MKSKNKFTITVLALALALIQAPGGNAIAQDSGEKPATVQDLGFKFESGSSRFTLTLDKDFSFEKNVSESDKQVIIDIKNAKIGKKWSKPIDASQFKSNVALISSYQSGDLVRVVLQLKENGGVEVTQDGKTLVASIDNKQAGEKKEELSTALTDPNRASDAPDAEKGDSELSETSAPPATDTGEAEAPAPTTAAKSTGDGDSLDTFFQSQQTKNFVGKHIFLQVRDAELTDVFRIISEASEFNIVLSDNVKGKIMLNLTDVPWDQALDLVLTSNRLAAERHGNVLRVTTADALTKEKEAEVAAKKALEAAEPLVVKIFPISYAQPVAMKTILTDFLSKEPVLGLPGTVSMAAATAAAPTRGSIQVDARTNSLIVRDTPTTIEKIKRIIKELDTQTPQVLIEAKFVEVTETRQKEVQGRIFSSSREFDGGAGQFAFRNTNNNYGALFGGSGFGELGTGFAISPTSGGGASFGFSPKAGLIPGMSEIGAFISILENEASAKVIASPRIVTQNKEQAEITQGQTIQLPVPTGANAAGGFQTINVVLRLNVVPQITNDGSITMKLEFSQDKLSAQQLSAGSLSTDTKRISTNVMVDSGATIVIGGIYATQVNTAEAGIPILRDLPILGPFFGSKANQSSKNELFIFLTPRVLNEKEAGIKG